MSIVDILNRPLANGDAVIVHDNWLDTYSVAVKLLFENVLYSVHGQRTDLNRLATTVEVSKIDIPANIKDQLLTAAQRNMTLPTLYSTRKVSKYAPGHALLASSGVVDVYLGYGKVMVNDDQCMDAHGGHVYIRLAMGCALDLRRMLANGTTPLTLAGDELAVTCHDNHMAWPSINVEPETIMVLKTRDKRYAHDLGCVPGFTPGSTVTAELTSPFMTDSGHVCFFPAVQ